MAALSRAASLVLFEVLTTVRLFAASLCLGLHLESEFSVLCGLAVEHPWHVSFRLTEVQLPVTRPSASCASHD